MMDHVVLSPMPATRDLCDEVVKSKIGNRKLKIKLLRQTSNSDLIPPASFPLPLPLSAPRQSPSPFPIPALPSLCWQRTLDPSAAGPPAAPLCTNPASTYKEDGHAGKCALPPDPHSIPETTSENPSAHSPPPCAHLARSTTSADLPRATAYSNSGC